MFAVLAVSLVIMLCVAGVRAQAIPSEVDLHEKLFARYNPDVMPLVNTSQSMDVSIQLFLMSLENLDEKAQTFTTRAFLELRWTDEFLMWNSSEYGGITTINVRNENIWLPDMALDYTFDTPTDLGQEGDRSVVDEHGSVVTWPYKTFTVGCRITIRNFPFDEQVCSFDFLSWTHPVSKLSLTVPEVGLSTYKYVESGEWDLVKHEVVHVQNPFGDDAWDHVVFKLTLRRKWLFYAMNMLAPLLCIALLNITCFILPAESGEKMSLAISIFLTLAVFLTIVSSEQPESSDELSILGLYIGLQLLGSGLTIVTTVIALYIYHIDTATHIPLVFRILGRLCCAGPSSQYYEVENVQTVTIGDHVPDTTKRYITDIDNNRNETSTVDIARERGRKQSRRRCELTWQMVSRGFDRLCWITGIAFQAVVTTVILVIIT